MKKIKKLFFFLCINLGSLALGSLLMNNGPRSAWYLDLEKAPWTPPGWVFGAAWTLIMICFSIYLSYLFSKNNSSKVKIAFALQVILNIGWNYIFFNLKQFEIGLIILLLLNVTLYFFYLSLSKDLKKERILLLPYIIWMSIATSLNLYIIIHN